MKKQAKQPSREPTINAGHILTTAELSARWGGSPSITTLANWAKAGIGPRWFKVGGKTSVRLYDLADVVTYETKKKAEAENGREG